MAFLGLTGSLCNKPFYWSHLSFDIEVLDAKQPSVKIKPFFFMAYISPLWRLELWHRQGHHRLGSKDISCDILWMSFLTSM
jgi:hypothetical protein